MPVPGAAGHTRAPPVSTRTAANAWALFSHHVVRPGTQQRLHVEQADLAVREGDFEQVSVVGAHRHDIGDKGFGDQGPLWATPCPQSWSTPPPAQGLHQSRTRGRDGVNQVVERPGVHRRLLTARGGARVILPRWAGSGAGLLGGNLGCTRP